MTLRTPTYHLRQLRDYVTTATSQRVNGHIDLACDAWERARYHATVALGLLAREMFVNDESAARDFPGLYTLFTSEIAPSEE